MNWKTGLAIGAVLVIAAFLVGFVPQYMNTRKLNDQLATAQRQLDSQREKSAMESAGLSISYVYLQTNIKNYGLASQSATKFFDRVRAMAGHTADSSWQGFVPAVMAKRDEVIGGLAKGDPATLTAVQDVFQRTLDATQSEWK